MKYHLLLKVGDVQRLRHVVTSDELAAFTVWAKKTFSNTKIEIRECECDIAQDSAATRILAGMLARAEERNA